MNRRIYSRERNITYVRYDEKQQTVLPHLFRGYTINGSQEPELCPFFDFCTVAKGFRGQVKCLANKRPYCRNEININRCNDNLSLG